jgi:hydrogenase expression/formation protein HypE
MSSCPVPFTGYDRVVLAHGGGGRAMHELVRERFVAAFDEPLLREGTDAAVLVPGGPIAVTTDAFVVRPLFFPGGDIGSLAVHGTVNDLATAGARPRWLAASFVLEEGLLLGDLDRIVASMASAARRCGVRVVTGDTKVVERGKGDGVFVTTTGIGEVVARSPISPTAVRDGDAVLVSGPVGDHGVAVMLARGAFGLESAIESDSAPVHELVLALLDAGVAVRALRDPTRGGLAAALTEIAAAARVGIRVVEEDVPVRPAVADACELLGLDPLLVACEGRLVAFVDPADAERALAVLRARPDGRQARRIGAVVGAHPGVVVLEGPYGADRVLDLPSGEQLPRIC